jgi:hypothetical protein
MLNHYMHKMLFIILGNNLRWNQTGVIVAGTTSSGSNANQLDQPSCLYIDDNNTLYICDYNNHRIQKWVQGATSGMTVAGSSAGTQGSSSTLLKNPLDLTFDQNGYMYVADSGNNRVQRFAPNSTNGTTILSSSYLSNPTAIDIDNNSNIYIVDEGHTRVVWWAQNATNGTVVISDSTLNNVFGIRLTPGSLNQVYMSDYGSSEIHLWTFGASSQDSSLSTVNDSSHNALKDPWGIIFDPYDNFYVADSGRDRVVMYCINSTTGMVVAVDSGGTPSLKQPVAVAFDSNLNMYVATQQDDQVVKLSRI